MLGVQFSFWRGLARQGSIRTGHFGILYSQIVKILSKKITKIKGFILSFPKVFLLVLLYFIEKLNIYS